MDDTNGADERPDAAVDGMGGAERAGEAGGPTRTTWRERGLVAGRVLAAATRRAWEWTRRAWRSDAAGAVRARSRRTGARVLAIGVSLRRPTIAAVVVAGLAYAAAWAATGPFLHRVSPGFVGVRHSAWGGGVAARDFGPGLHWTLPGLHDWHALDAGTREVEFGTFSPALELRTPEGNVVGVAVSVPYRLMEGAAHRVVAESLRSGHAELVRANVEAVLLTELGRASSEDWLDGETRRGVLAAAGAKVGAELARLHVESDGVLLQALRFPPPYEAKLREIQRGSQQRRLSEASANLKNVQGEVDRGAEENARVVQRRRDELDYELTRLEAERRGEVERFRGESEDDVRVTRLAADRTYAELVEEGRRAVLDAELEARALADRALEGPEGRLYLAVQAARTLRLGDVALDPADPRLPNLLDPEAAAALFLPEED